MITVEGLSKHYEVHERAPGLRAALRSLFVRQKKTVAAVDGVSFTIEAGERVGFLGPNGAGKTTTLKVLSGLLYPTSGTVRVAGFDPTRRDDAFLRRIMLVLGQKQQLMWDLPPSDTFELNRAIYGVPRDEYAKTLNELVELLEIGPLLGRPTRQLSLGERMKCELAAALVHTPSVLFLDEPTIGLDVAMQDAIRGFIKRHGERHGATVLLTSHYMMDVAALCPRVIVLDGGKVTYDGSLDALVRKVRPGKRVVLRLERPVAAPDAEALGRVVSNDGLELVLQVAADAVNDVVSRALTTLPVGELTVGDPPLEEVMREIFGAGPKAARSA
jgi:ABC-2 type transport system ATP-binding protein